MTATVTELHRPSAWAALKTWQQLRDSDDIPNAADVDTIHLALLYPTLRLDGLRALAANVLDIRTNITTILAVLAPDAPEGWWAELRDVTEEAERWADYDGPEETYLHGVADAIRRELLAVVGVR